MQIVIDIDEDLYDHIKNSYILCSGMRTGKSFIAVIFNAIANGTSLPKGHGRLIDADKLHHCECKGNFSECDTCLDDDLCNLVNEAPTIIEADKGE